MVISSSNQLDRIIKEEESYFKSLIVQLKKQKINFIFSQQDFSSEGISDNLLQMLTKYKIQFIPNIKKNLMKKIVNLSNSTLLTSQDQLKESSNFGILEGKFNSKKKTLTSRNLIITNRNWKFYNHKR